MNGKRSQKTILMQRKANAATESQNTDREDEIFNIGRETVYTERVKPDKKLTAKKM